MAMGKLDTLATLIAHPLNILPCLVPVEVLAGTPLVGGAFIFDVTRVTVNCIPDQDELISWNSWPRIPMPGKAGIQAYLSQSLIPSVGGGRPRVHQQTIPPPDSSNTPLTVTMDGSEG